MLMPEKPPTNPKTFISFPLGIFLALAILSIFIEVTWSWVMGALMLVIVYFIVMIVIELFNK